MAFINEKKNYDFNFSDGFDKKKVTLSGKTVAEIMNAYIHCCREKTCDWVKFGYGAIINESEFKKIV